MRDLRKRWLVLPLCLGGLSVAASTPVPEAECAVAARWVKYNAVALPSSLAEFSSYPLAYRKAIYGELTREAKLALWHEQVGHYLRVLPLTEAQRQFIVQVDGEMDQYFGPENSIARHRQDYVARAKAILGFDVAKRIFADLGIATPEQIALDSGSVLPGQCNCNSSGGGDFCNPFGSGCSTSSGPCEGLIEGCGWWWCEVCNGTCPP